MHLYAGSGERCAGEVELCGVPLAGNGPAGSLARGMALVGEDRKRHGLVLDQEVGFNLSLSSLRGLTRRGLIDGDAEVRANRRLFDGLRVKAPGLSTLVATLSGGNQQKVVLGKALMTEPQVVLLDEPTRGIDVGAKREVYELVDGLVAEGKAVLLASSEMPELLGVADRLLVLSRGRVGGSFPDTNVTQDDLLRAAMACGEEAPR
jgi:D-xylose transport system ATP-binding protein